MIFLDDFVVCTSAGMHETVRGNAIDGVLLVGQAEVDNSHGTLDTSRQQKLRHSTARSRILDRGHLCRSKCSVTSNG